jgi:Domain of unknown function (DUF5666)
MKQFYSSFLIALLSFVLVNTSTLWAADATTPKVKKIPFHGKLVSSDEAAQTITIGGKTPRVFHLTPATKITDGSGQTSSLSAAVAGEDVGGSYTKDATGTMTLFSVRFGAKTGSKAASSAPAVAASPEPAASPAPAPPPAAPTAPMPEPAAAAAPAAAAPAAAEATKTAKAKSQRFSGKVVSVDATGGTLIVHGKADQTFTVSATTKFTGGSSLADVTPGAKVSGSYVKSPDGATMTLNSLKIAK